MIKKMSRGVGMFAAVAAVTVLAAAIGVLGGCATMDRAYRQEVSWTNAPVVHVFTNTVIVTNTVPVMTERTNIVYVTNSMSGAVAAVATREAVATNVVTQIVTNVVPVFMTNLVQVPMTNLTAAPEATATIGAVGSVVNTFVPGIGSILALVIGGLYHGYRQVRNRKINEALIQGVETARAVLTTTPQGQAADAQFVRWLMEHQKEAGVFTTVSGLVQQLSDNPAAKMTAQEIAKRVEQANRGAAQTAQSANS